MKKLNIGILAFSGLVFLNSCGTTKTADAAQKTESTISVEPVRQEEVKEEGINLSYMDKSVRPQDDFFSYVNGNWVKTTQIPSDKASWGSFNALRENVDDASLEILSGILSESYPAGSEGQKIQNLYASFMDTNKRNADGLSPIKADLAKIDAIKNLNDLQKYLLDATKLGDNSFYGWRVGADLKDSKMNAVYLGGPDLGLGRDYYQKVNEANTKTLAEYQSYVGKLFGVLGYKNAEASAKNVVDFEKQLGNYLLTLEQNRDANLRYNPKNVSELGSLVKNVNLAKYLKDAGVDTNRVIIGELKYYQNMDQFVTQKNLPLLKDYLKYHLINGNASNLDEKLEQIRFDFYSKYLQGQKEQRPMNKRGLSLVNGVLGEAFGKLYVEKYFPAEAKAQMVELIDYLKKSFAVHINNLAWMSATTKVKATEKLNKFTVKVAYPDKWKDYSKLNIVSEAKGGNLYSNLQNITEWQYNKDLAKIGKPVDKSEWGMTPQTVNAYYNPVNNEIVFPAAILQPPFFNPQADAAVNFGGIGAVIGHEMSHGFDDSGAQFDADGNLVDWWTPEDKANFEKATKALAAQYDKYEPVKGTFVNGTFTNGENIADLGGVNIAYDALQMYLKDKGNPGLISGFTQDQRFFMSWATVWRTKATDQYMTNQVKTDPHSPGIYRAFGPLVNQDAFIKAFDIKPGDKMYKAPADRIKIW